MPIKRSDSKPPSLLEVLPSEEEPLAYSSPTKFLSDIDENDIGRFNTDIPREEFVVLENGKASIEVQGELVACLMTKQYEKARDLCQLVLRVEPDHKVCKEMYGVVCERIEQLEEQKLNPPNQWDSDSESESDSGDDGSDGSSSSDESSSKTENDDEVITHKVGDLTISYQT